MSVGTAAWETKRDCADDDDVTSGGPVINPNLMVLPAILKLAEGTSYADKIRNMAKSLRRDPHLNTDTLLKAIGSQSGICLKTILEVNKLPYDNRDIIKGCSAIPKEHKHGLIKGIMYAAAYKQGLDVTFFNPKWTKTTTFVNCTY